ncbi:MAG: hypothetical protein II401_06260 [Bacteroidales bacterium]|nr:hypothetical protein [Bacteroidales bacterium]
MKKKRLIIMVIVSIITMSIMTSCAIMDDPDFQEGFRQGWNSTAPAEYRY